MFERGHYPCFRRYRGVTRYQPGFQLVNVMTRFELVAQHQGAAQAHEADLVIRLPVFVVPFDDRDFHAQQPPTDSHNAALSRALVLSQLLLIAGDHDGYLSHCTNVVAPLAIQMGKNPTDKLPENSRFVLPIAAGLCLAPLFRPDFLSGMSDAALQQNIPIWNNHRNHLEDGLPAMAADLVLRAAALNRDDTMEAKAAEERIARNPAGHALFADKLIDEVLAGWFDSSPLTLFPFASRP